MELLFQSPSKSIINGLKSIDFFCVPSHQYTYMYNSALQRTYIYLNSLPKCSGGTIYYAFSYRFVYGIQQHSTIQLSSGFFVDVKKKEGKFSRIQFWEKFSSLEINSVISVWTRKCANYFQKDKNFEKFQFVFWSKSGWMKGREKLLIQK